MDPTPERWWLLIGRGIEMSEHLYRVTIETNSELIRLMPPSSTPGTIKTIRGRSLGADGIKSCYWKTDFIGGYCFWFYSNQHKLYWLQTLARCLQQDIYIWLAHIDRMHIFGYKILRAHVDLVIDFE